MRTSKKIIAAIASVLIFSISGIGQAQAAEIAINGTTDWISNDQFMGVDRGDGYSNNAMQTDNSYRLNGTYNVDVTDYQASIDSFSIYLNNVFIGNTGPKTQGAQAATAADGWADPNFSKGTFFAGQGLLTIFAQAGSASWGNYGIRFTSFVFQTGNALRVDSAGATTEKNNVVSCTPGKYTFLNGGSTPETANIQSYVYTLLVNGKAVSTISSDNFRSVASHMFPTIAGNMAGTATLEGATWDLKGMSNYSAQCQVYATQSGGNIQSVTTAAHDAVALAAAAEAAANVARNQEIISTWNASNEELAKKYRDQRLAVQP